MNGFLLDTNVPSELVRPRPDPGVTAWLAAQSLDALFISAVSFGELRKGIELRDPGERKTKLDTWLHGDLTARFLGRILPLTQAIAERWGIMDAHRQRMGRPLSALDGMIAATAMEHGLIVVTRNVKDFGDLGITIFNPWDAT